MYAVDRETMDPKCESQDIERRLSLPFLDGMALGVYIAPRRRTGLAAEFRMAYRPSDETRWDCAPQPPGRVNGGSTPKES